MRLSTVTASGFRAFSSEIAFDLDADAVIVLGSNGRGKTSLFDAILWALAGEVPRLGAGPQHVLSKFSDSGIARVALELSTQDGLKSRVSRVLDRENTRAVFEVNGDRVQGPAAESQILSSIWPRALAAPDPTVAFGAALRRSVYLEQDRVRDFIDTDDAQARFNAVSELIGAGRVSEIQRQLENEKKQWATASNRLRRDLESKERELAEHREKLGQLDDMSTGLGPTGAKTALVTWWSQIHDLGLPIAIKNQLLEPAHAGSSIDVALRELEDSRLQVERQRDEAALLLEEITNPPFGEPADVEPLQVQATAIEGELESSLRLLTELEEQIKVHRQTQRELNDALAELSLLADIALRHLGEFCPVCQQTYDRETTTQHLQGLMQADKQDNPLTLSPGEGLSELRERITQLETQKESTRAELGKATGQHRRWLAWKERVADRADRLDLDPDQDLDSLAQSLAATVSQLDHRAASLAKLRLTGESFALATARLRESAQRSELAEQLKGLTSEYEELRDEVKRRDEIGSTAETIIAALRDATETLVDSKIREIEPLLKRLYARVDPHVEFRAVKLLTNYARGRGHLSTQLSDLAEEHVVEAPETILSSSQMNALAVSIFLSFNLGLDSLPLDVAILDDPLQSLDDVNLLGLVDMLRRTRERRQLIVSTHDRRFGELLQRKLRPVREGQRTVVISFDGWDRNGPVVNQTELPQSDSSLRVVA